MIHITLCFVYKGIDLLETFQIPYRTGEEHTEYHIHIIDEAFSTTLLITDKVYHHICLKIAYCDSDLTLVYDTKRHGGIWRTGTYLLDIRNTQDDKHPSVVVLITRSLIGIGDVGEEIVRDVEFLL